MLSEFKRVLKPGGILFLSTPNQQITSPNGSIKNPYHTQEFSFDQLKELLQIFSAVDIKGQKFVKFDKGGLRNKRNKILINFLLMRGIRKIPFYIKEKIAKALTNQTLYPTENDFLLVDSEKDIRNRCPVLFAICKK
jgi:ubiquinone/menaquinone biosynthesis C-methylase UbiE